MPSNNNSVPTAPEHRTTQAVTPDAAHCDIVLPSTVCSTTSAILQTSNDNAQPGPTAQGNRVDAAGNDLIGVPPTPLAPRFAVSYERQSDEFAEGIDAQYFVNAAAALQDGLTIPNSPEYRYSDDSTSGKVTSRKGLNRLLTDAEEGTLPGVGIYIRTKDRLGRFADPRRIFYLEVTLSDLGYPIRYSDQSNRQLDYEVEDSSGEVVTSFITGALQSIMARDERIKISTRTREGTRNAVTRGFYTNKQAPYGMERCLVDIETHKVIERVPDGIVVHRDGCRYGLQVRTDGTADIVTEIYTRLDSGVSLRQIALDLTARGVPVPSNAGGRKSQNQIWHPSVIRQIAKNPIYYGDYIHGRTVKRFQGTPPVPAAKADITSDGMILVEGMIEDPPVTRELWDRVQATLGAHQTIAHERLANPRLYPLSGIIRCDECGASYSGFSYNSDGRQPLVYYRHAVARADAPPQICGNTFRYVRADHIEPVIDALLKEVLSDPRLPALVQAEIEKFTADAQSENHMQDVLRLRERLATHESAIANASYEVSLINCSKEDTAAVKEIRLKAMRSTIAQHAKICVDLQHQIDELEATLARIAAASDSDQWFVKSLPALLGAYDDATAQERTRILRLIFDSVRVVGPTREIEVVVGTQLAETTTNPSLRTGIRAA